MGKPPPPPGHERRRHIRHDLIAEVELRRGGEVCLLPVLNVSLGGAFVERRSTDALVLSPGDDLEVSLSSTTAATTITLPARVVRIDLGGEHPGVALAWVTADGELLGRLEAFLAR
jgi:hypothetical protein